MRFYREQAKQGVVCNYGITDQFKSSYISVDFILPLTVENATGMSLLAGVLSRGCKAYPQMDKISRFLAKNYGASLMINAGKAGEMEILTVALRYLDNAYAIDGEDIQGEMISFLKELLFVPLVENGGFIKEYVEQEKSNHADKIRGLFNDKRLYSLEQCKALMCDKEPFGICEMGTLEKLADYDSRLLYEYYLKMMDEAFITLSYVGKDESRNLTELANSFDARKATVPMAIEGLAPAEVREIVDPMNLNQSKLNLGFRLGAAAQKNGAACRLFNVLYGGSANSKLFMNVRERLSLCYYCSSTIDRFKNVMFVSSGVEAEKYELARKEILAQLDAVKNGEFTADEFESAKSYLIDSVRGSLDNKGAISAAMTSNTLRGEEKTPAQDIEEIQAVRREDVIAVAQGVTLDTVYFLKGVQGEE